MIGHGKSAAKIMSMGLVALLTMIVLALPAGASPPIFELIEPHINLYNENIDQIPAPVKRLFQNERINLHIILEDGTEEIIGIATSKKECEIIEFTDGALNKPTLRVYIDWAKIERLLSEPDQSEIINTVLNLRIEGVGLFKQLKVFFFHLFQRIAGGFLT